MPIAYPVEAPAIAKAEVEKIYDELIKSFPEAKLEINEETGNYRISMDGAEPFMTIVEY